MSDIVFSIADQIKYGIDNIDDESPELRIDIAKLYELAGMQASANADHAASRSYLINALALLPTDLWKSHYDLSLRFSLRLAKSCYSCGDLEKAHSILGETMVQCHSLEDNLQDRKAPEPPVMTLDLQTAAKAFLEMTTSLSKLRGITGIPLSYVPRFTLKSPNNLAPDDPIRNLPAFGKAGSPYSSVDDELVARAAILRNDLTQGQLAASLETLESEGPFEPAFMADMALVLPVDAQITAFAPSSAAFEIAIVIPRSLKEPVGLAPSTFNQTSLPSNLEKYSA